MIFLGIFIFCSLFSTIFACGCEVALPQDPFDALGPWHQRHLDCGIPPFAYRLPQDAQAKIHGIWIKYEAGEDCEEEQDQTRAVIMSIPDEVRYQIFKGVCGPGFLKNESDITKDAFRKIWFDENLSIEQKQTEFKKFGASVLSGESLKRFEKFDRSLEEHIKKRQSVIDKLSPAGKEAYNRWNGMRREERMFLAGLPAEVRADLGLICKCCGGCKTGGKTANQSPSRATRATALSNDNNISGLSKSDSELLFQAAAVECTY